MVRRKGRDNVPRQGRSIDFLGYCFDGQSVRLRKSIKQRFARKAATLNGEKRTKMLSSYWGWCKWGNCKNLWCKITNNDMSFADKGIKRRIERLSTDGKRVFDAQTIKLMDIVNVPVTVIDFETGIVTKQGPDRYLVLIKFDNGQLGKFITNSFDIKDVLDQARISENNGAKVFPVDNVVVKRKTVGNNKYTYYFDE